MNIQSFLGHARLSVDLVTHCILKAVRSETTSAAHAEIVNLEERIMLSASPVVDVMVDLEGQTDVQGEGQLQAESNLTTTMNEADAHSASRQVVIVDPQVEGYQQLIGDLTGESGIEVLLLDQERDGIEQISEFLKSHRDLSAIHIVSHGNQDSFQIGSTTLSNQSLLGYAADISSWESALSDQADILIYGCDLASTESGRTLVHSLGSLTGADVAASDDLTGQQALGGDWQLEYSVGSVESDVVFSIDVMQSWHGVLQSVSVTTTLDNNTGDTSSIAALLTNDGGDGISLREAIIAANNTAGSDTINLGAGTYTMSIAGMGEDASFTGDLDITDDLTIVGLTPGLTQIDAAGIDRVFHVHAGTLTISDVTIRGGNAGVAGLGGGIHIEVGAAMIGDRLDVRSNQAAEGGGICNMGDLSLYNSLVYDNTVSGQGGGIRSIGTMELVNVTVSENLAPLSSAGISVDGGSTTLTNVTIANNSGYGLAASSAVTMQNTISADNALDDVVGAAVNSLGGNVIGDGTGFGFGPSDSLGVDPGLGLLADYGGPVWTHAISVSSVAYNYGVATGAPTRDARGYSRAGSTDAGAFQAISTLIVDTTSDTVDGVVTSVAALNLNPGSDGRISLREALLAANADSGTLDLIQFEITDALVSGTHTIMLTSELPDITDSIIVDATTDSDFVSAPIVVLDGSSAGVTDGLTLLAGSDGSLIRGLVINEFTGSGIHITGSDNNTIVGNYIGTDHTGTLDQGNAERGIEIFDSSGNVVGGSSPSDRNVIAGNDEDGIAISGVTSTANVVEGNFIGSDGAAASVGNAEDGIVIDGGASSTRISGNLIASSGWTGIAVEGAGSGTIIQGNTIGTDSELSANWGSGHFGIFVNGSMDVLIGGSNSGDGNVISFSGQGGTGDNDGIAITGVADNVSVLGNTIDSNLGQAIDLWMASSNDGVTPNDGLFDPDTGPNDLQNFPVFSSANLNGSNLALNGLLNSQANTQYRIEVFAIAAGVQDGTGYGEADRYLGFLDVTTDASGLAVINTTLTDITLSAGDYVSATATEILDDANVGVNDLVAFGDTSELAQNMIVVSTNSAPVLNSGPSLTLSDITQNDTNPPGNTIANILAQHGDDRITDSDAGAAEGIAITGRDNSNGVWQFSTNGGSSWTNFGTVSSGNATVLADSAMIRYVPNSGYTGTTGNLSFRAWDQTDGSLSGQTGVDIVAGGIGGTGAYSIGLSSIRGEVVLPEAVIATSPDNFNTAINTPLTFNPLANDTDAQGDAIQVVDLTQPTNGSVVDNGNGTLTYTPDGGFVGTDQFDYVAIDAGVGLQHYWGLDGDVLDAIGSADGVAANTTTEAGDFGDALRFDETNSVVTLPDVTYNPEFTISFEFKVDEINGTLFQYLYSHGDIDSPNSINIYIVEDANVLDPNTLRTVIRDGNDTLDNLALDIDIGASGLNLVDGQFHTYTVSVGSDGIRVYVDGVLAQSDSTRGTDGVDPAGSAYLGVRQNLDPDRKFGGVIDSVQIFDNALSSSQISDLANNLNHGSVQLNVNNASQLGVAAPPLVAMFEDTTSIFAGANVIQVDNGVSADSRMQVSLSVSDGVLTLANTSGIQFVTGGNGLANMVIEGLESDLNQALDGLEFTPNENFAGASVLTITASIDADLAGYYSFEGGDADDVSVGGSQHGSLVGTASIVSDPARAGFTLDLDGAGYADLSPHAGTFGSFDSGTIATWLNTSSSQTQTFFALTDSADVNSEVTFSVQADGRISFQVFEAGVGALAFQSSQVVNDGAWHHVAVTVDSSGPRLFINGLEDTSLTFSSGGPATQAFLNHVGTPDAATIGAKINSSGTIEWFDGALDDVQIFSRALSENEVALLANEQSQLNSISVISVGQVNDAPVIDDLDGDVIMAKNDGISVSLDPALAASISDIDSSNFDGGFVQLSGVGFDPLDQLGIDVSGTVALSAGVTNGSLVSVGGVNVGTLSGVANDGLTVTLNSNATVSRVELILQSFTFSTTSGNFGNRDVTLIVNDGDATANGGADTDTANMTVNVAADSGMVTAVEDSLFTFSASDFAFTGTSGADLQEITITSLPANGTLLLNSVAVTNGQTVDRADIDAGRLQFLPDPEDNGVGYAHFEFFVNSGRSVVTALAGTPNAYTFNGAALMSTDEILESSANFGPGGVHPTDVQLGPAGTIDAAYLAGGEILFGGFIADASITAAELTAIDSWVSAGGVLITNNDAISHDPISSHFGLIIGGTASATWNVTNPSHPIMDGPFGTVGSFQAAGTISYFDRASLQPGDVELAVDSVSGQPTVVLRQSGAGWILFTSDEGIFRANMTGSGTIATDNDILVANLFAWAIDQVDPVTHQMNIDVTAVNDAPYFVSLPDAAETTAASGVNSASTVVSVDLDNDGDLDLVSTTDTGEIRWHENDGTGNFGVGTLFDTEQNFNSVAVFDLDSDGDLDIVATNDDPADLNNGVFVYYNNFIGSGAVSFSELSFEGSGVGDFQGASGVVVGDVDQNGFGDIVVTFTAGHGDAHVVLFEQESLGNFVQSTIVSYTGVGYGVALADIDNDTYLDIVAAEYNGTNQLSWYRNDQAANPSFTQNVVGTSQAIYTIDTGDMDGDGDIDIVTANWGDDEIEWWENDGGATPSFTQHLLYAEPSALFYKVDVADVDGDGSLDIVAAVKNRNDILLFENDGSGDFATATLNQDAGAPEWLDVADLDNDGNLDVVFASNSGNSIEFHTNRTDGFIRGVVNEDTTLGGLSVQIADDDAGAGILEVSITVTQGTVSFSTASVTVISGGVGTSFVTFEGSVAGINSALNSLSFTPAADYVGVAEIMIEVNDRGNTGVGGALSAQESIHIEVLPVNDAPLLVAGTVQNLTVAEDSGFTSLGLGGVLHSPGGGADEIGQTVTYQVNVIPSPAFGQIYLADETTVVGIGTYTLAEIQGMKFRPADDVFGGPSFFQFVVVDDGGVANGGSDQTTHAIQLNVTPVADAPILTLDAGGLTYVENGPAMAVSPGASVTDSDSTDVDGGTLTIGYGSGGTAFDQISVLNIGTGAGQIGVSGSNVTYGGLIIGTIGGGGSDGVNGDQLVITFNGNATLPVVQELLRHVAYSNSSDNPSEADRVIEFTLDDGDGGTSATVGRTVAPSRVNDAPSVATNTGATVAEGSLNNTITTAQLNEGDPDDDGAALTYRITDATDNGTLFLNGVGALGINDTFTQADIDAGDVYYDHDGSETVGDAFNFELSDGGEDGASPITGTFNFTVIPTNDVPLIDLDLDDSGGVGGVDYATSYNAGAAAVSLADGALLTDVDGTIQQLRIEITNIQDDADEILAFTGNGNIASSYTPSLGLLQFFNGGSATNAMFEAILNSLTYENISANPGTTARVITFVATDGVGNSVTATTTMTVNGDATPPNVAVNAGSTVNEGEQDAIENFELAYTDDLQDTASIRYTITTAPTNGFLALVGSPTVPISQFTQADIDAGNLIYAHDGSETTSDTMMFTVDDSRGNSIANQTFNITVLPVNDAPMLDNSGNTELVAISEDNFNPPGQTVFDILQSGGIDQITDDDAGAVEGIAVIGVNDSNGVWEYSLDGTSWLSFAANGVSTTGANSSSAVLLDPMAWIRFVPAADFSGDPGDLVYRGWDQTDGNPSGSTGVNLVPTGGSSAYSNATETLRTFVNPVNDAPFITVNSGATVVEGGQVAIDGASLSGFDIDDNATELTFTITTPPVNGQLERITGPGVAITSFTQSEVNLGQIIYVHDGSETTGDTFAFSLADGGEDGAGPVVGSFDITVIPSNDAPIITSPSAQAFFENALVSFAVTSTDVDGGIPAYSIVGGADQAHFAIDSVTGVVTLVSGPKDFESPDDADFDNVYQIRIRVDDGLGGITEQDLTVTINDVNEAPGVLLTNVVGSLIESTDTTSSVKIADIVAIDDALGTNSFVLSGADANDFTIVGGNELHIKAGTVLDAESKTNFDVVIEIDDAAVGGVPDGTATTSLLITDADEFDVGAIFDTDVVINQVDENATIGTQVGITAFATDADLTNNLIQYSLTDDDGGRFSVDTNSGVVTVAGAIDREAIGGSRTIVVRATSVDGSYSEQLFTISVNDLDEFDVGLVQDTNPAINAVFEGDSDGTLVGITAAAVDLDSTNNSIIYSLADDAGGRFAIDSLTGQVSIADSNLLDFESNSGHSIMVRATSADGSSATQVFDIDIWDSNEFDPTILDQTFSVVENAPDGRVVGTIVADDLDTSQSLTYSVVGGSGASAFVVDVNTGEITVADGSQLDFEVSPSLSLQVVVSDDLSPVRSSSATITINLIDVNEAPTVSLINAMTDLLESVDNSLGTTIATISVDDDALGVNDLTLSGADSQFFEIIGNELRVRSGVDIDYESVEQYAVRVNVDDAALGTNPDAFVDHVLRIQDVDDTAPVIAAGQVLTVNENSLVNTLVGSIIATDVDTTTPLTSWTITGAGTEFQIDANFGVITVSNGAGLNFEDVNSFDLMITVSDGIQVSAPETVRVNVQDVNDAPVAVDEFFSTFEFNGVLVSQPGVLANDFDEDGDAFIAQVVSQPQNGDLIFNADGSLTYIPNVGFFGTDTFEYLVSDGLLNSNVATVSIETIIAPSGGSGGSDSANDKGSTHSPDPVMGDGDSDGQNLVTESPTFIPQINFNTSESTSVDDVANVKTGEGEGQSVVLVLPSSEAALPEEQGKDEVAGRIRTVSLDANLQRIVLASQTTFTASSLSISPRFIAVDDNVVFKQAFDFDELLVGSSAITTTSLSVGYVLWMLRGGSLIASFVSSLPAWSAFDPLPFVRDQEVKEESESLSNIVDCSGRIDSA